MATDSLKFRRNLFEIDNARNLTRDELVATFVPNDAFRRLFSAKNHIVLGARGSGKTALAKMLSHDHLSRMQDDESRRIVQSKSFIGVYVPTRLEWVGGLRNKPWQTEHEKELFFQWRLNLSTCLAFLRTAQSCLDVYINDLGKRARLESKLAADIASSWSNGVLVCETLREIEVYLENIEHEKQQQLARFRAVGALQPGELPVGLAFEMELFAPLRRAIALVARALQFPDDSTWLLCLDEAEFLDASHHRILNSYLRAFSGNLFFKITTMPYFHHTLETNVGVSLDYGHDFEYVYIDQDPILLASQGSSDEKAFAGQLFNKRALVSYSPRHEITLKGLLGNSPLLATGDDEDWSPDSRNFKLLTRYGSAATVQRAQRLMPEKEKFRNEISRKIRGALLLRDMTTRERGRIENDLYCGAEMVIRCGDANPRRLIRLFNNLLMGTKWDDSPRITLARRLSPVVQTRILTGFSSSTLSRVQSEPHVGPALFELLFALGTYMKHCLHDLPLSTDQISSVRVGRGVGDFEWGLIRRAVGLGYLFPNIGTHNPDQMPEREGVFHMGYVLAAHFRILPRRGKPRHLDTIMSYASELRALKKGIASGQELLFPEVEGGPE